MPVVISLRPDQKVYFASDFHLGVPTPQASAARERRIVRWLEHVRKDAHTVFLLGDIFDFWFEYRHSIPKGFVRFQGKLAELKEQGIAIHFFTGNHDMWMFDYFPTELGIPVHRQPVTLVVNDKKFLIGHGDGLGPGDTTYKILKKFFNSGLCQWLFARIHPNLGMSVAHFWSRQSRISNTKQEEKFVSEEREFLLTYCREVEKTTHHDYYVFGHRHLPLDLAVSPDSRYINLGEWVHFNTFASFANNTLELTSFEG
ncbi:MAG: UDP-2,3-diacylglucosamine diphosphatase [Cyclobacteriaceae bacterium]|jgi:UDP-2,3-diacylglucosamine hydrolase|nr:UDP-2,3-diacylglucosamine diphosphatase [Cyclobacteriaceae bacterium]